MILDALESLSIPIASVHADPANARKHSARNIDTIKASLSKFGQRKPIVVQRQGMIVRAGNGTLEAARALGWDAIAAVVVDEGDIEATAYAIADNRSGDPEVGSEWDDGVLAEMLEKLKAEDFDLAGLGFEENEFDRLKKKVQGSDALSNEPQLTDGTYMVNVICESESHQASVIEKLEREGLTCRALIV